MTIETTPIEQQLVYESAEDISTNDRLKGFSDKFRQPYFAPTMNDFYEVGEILESLNYESEESGLRDKNGNVVNFGLAESVATRTSPTKWMLDDFQISRRQNIVDAVDFSKRLAGESPRVYQGRLAQYEAFAKKMKSLDRPNDVPAYQEYIRERIFVSNQLKDMYPDEYEGFNAEAYERRRRSHVKNSKNQNEAQLTENNSPESSVIKAEEQIERQPTVATSPADTMATEPIPSPRPTKKPKKQKQPAVVITTELDNKTAEHTTIATTAADSISDEKGSSDSAINPNDGAIVSNEEDSRVGAAVPEAVVDTRAEDLSTEMRASLAKEFGNNGPAWWNQSTPSQRAGLLKRMGLLPEDKVEDADTNKESDASQKNRWKSIVPGLITGGVLGVIASKRQAAADAGDKKGTFTKLKELSHKTADKLKEFRDKGTDTYNEWQAKRETGTTPKREQVRAAGRKIIEAVKHPLDKTRNARLGAVALAKENGAKFGDATRRLATRGNLYINDPEKGKRRKAAIIIGAVAVAGLTYLAIKNGTSMPTGPKAHELEPLTPKNPNLPTDGATETVTPPSGNGVTTPEVAPPSNTSAATPEVTSPATANAAPQQLEFNTSAGTVWEAMSRAGIPDEQIMARLEDAAKASGLQYEFITQNSDRWLELTLQDGSKVSDVSGILSHIGKYITK